MPKAIDKNQLTDFEKLYPQSVRVFALSDLKTNKLVHADNIVMWLISMFAGVYNGTLVNIRSSEISTPSVYIWICFLSSLIFLSLLALEIARSLGRAAKIARKIKSQSVWPNYVDKTLKDMENRYWSACSKGSVFNRTRWVISKLPIVGPMLKVDLRTQCLHVLSDGGSDRLKIKDTIILTTNDTGQVGYRNLFNNSTPSERLSLYTHILSNADQYRLTKKQKNIVHTIILSLSDHINLKGENKSEHIKQKLNLIDPENGITVETIHKYILANTHSSLDLILHKSSWNSQ